MERVRVLVHEISGAVGAADGAHYGVVAAEELGGQLVAEATADAGDQPVVRRHVVILPGGGLRHGGGHDGVSAETCEIVADADRPDNRAPARPPSASAADLGYRSSSGSRL